MLPRDGSLTAEQIESVRLNVADYATREGVSRAAIAKQLGVGQSTVSEFLTGAGKGNVEALARKLNGWVEQHARAKHPDRPREFVTTRIVERIFKVIRDVQRTSSAAVIFGPSGVSKTEVCREAMTTQVVGSVHIPCNNTCTSVRALSRLWCERLGLPIHGQNSDRFERIVSALSGSGRVQLFDDAHKMLPTRSRRVGRASVGAVCPSVEFIFDVHDQAGVPLVLFGTIEIDQVIGDEQAWAGQLSSRVKLRYSIADSELGEGKPLFTPNEVIEFAKTLGPQFKLAGDGAIFLCKLVSIAGFGGLRRARMLLSTAAAVAASRKRGSIGESEIRAALTVSYGKETAKRLGEQASRMKVATA